MKSLLAFVVISLFTVTLATLRPEERPKNEKPMWI